MLENAINSNTEIELFHNVDVYVTIIPRPIVAARILIERLFSTDDLLRVKKKSMIAVPSELQEDLKCFPQAVIIGKFLADHKYDRLKTISKLFKNNGKLLKSETDKLIRETFKSNLRYGSEIDDLYKYHKVLNNYSIYVFNDIFKASKIAYSIESKNVSGKRKIFLYLITQMEPHQHILTITDLKRFFGRKYMCNFCNLPIQNKIHTYFQKCLKCFKISQCRQRKKKVQFYVINA